VTGAGIKKKKPVTLGVARMQSVAAIPDGSPGNRDALFSFHHVT